MADRLCDRVGVMRSSLLIVDSPAALRKRLFGRTVVFHLSRPAQTFAAALESLDFIQKTEALDNKLVVQMDDPETGNPQVIRKLVESGADIQFVGEVRQSLEDIYLQIMRNTEGGRV